MYTNKNNSGAAPVFRRIAEDLRQRIGRREFPDKQLPVERLLADEYHTTRVTLRKALRLLTNARIVIPCGRRGYLLNGDGRGHAASAATRKITLAAILMRRKPSDEFHARSLLALEAAAANRGATLRIHPVGGEDELRQRAAELTGACDGILVSGLPTPADLRLLKRQRVPLALCGHLMYADPIEEGVDRVLLDSMSYGHLATRHLTRLGHRRIALVNGPSFRAFLNICQGYMKAVEDAGIEYDESMVVKCGEDSVEEGRGAAARLLDRGGVTAVFGANDRLACGVLAALAARGLRAPEHVSVVGFGNHACGLEASPPLTTIEVDHGFLAEKALSFLIGRINGDCGRPKKALIPFKLVERGTCGIAPQQIGEVS